MRYVSGAETVPEEVDQARKGCPPEGGTSEESGNNESPTPQSGHIDRFDRRDFEDGEEGQDIGDDQDEIGDRQSEYRGEILPESCSSGTIPAYLGYRILEKDIDPDDDDEDSGDDA